ncbi:WXG100 family type VII secretion target [Microbacterium sp. zg.Y625]|uniref:WXG100 family type VII secretion target n=1 Tax=Microbacterium jiangjiandongii TaxID=3049071 RepID=UPI00214AAEA4|nr:MULTISPECIES: WXG100 family type VII secretion target [unclassified Microbacterium]MCR2793202.1 WXG100 family type VII secretion target [Microbacterium sp. zg.Y625]WIM25419.1 WXG100 family type VII secretion target [Microbacterium sp. zg-Y625]
MTLDLSDDIARVDAALGRLSRVQTGLGDVRLRAIGLARETDWQSSAAQAFRDAVDGWVEGIARLDRPMEHLRERLMQTRDRLESTWVPDP